MYSDTRFKKSALRSAVLLALSINGAAITLGTGITHAASEVCATPNLSGNTLAVSTDSANFTMLDAVGGVVGGTNDVVMTWNGTAYNANSDYTGPGSVANVTASSTAPFFGHAWTAHDIQMFLPGSYSFDVTLSDGRAGQAGESGNLNVTVPAGMLGMHMLFDWNGNLNIDVFVVAAPDNIFGTGLLYSTVQNASKQFKCDTNFTGTITQNCLYDGALYGSAGAPTKSKLWMLASVDGNGNGVMGIPMPTGGPFPGFNANFSMPGLFSGLSLQNTCAGFVDTIPDPFSFTPVTNAAFTTLSESDVIIVGGLGAGLSSPISITGGQYSVSTDGGVTWSAYSSTTPANVQNLHRVKVQGTSPSANNQTTTVALNIGGITGNFTISTPFIASAQGSNFTMLDTSGITGGTNDVIANWDGTSDTNVNSTVFTRMTLSSGTPFFSFKWTAHHIRVFGPGTYIIDTTCTVAQLEAGNSNNCNNPPDPDQVQQFYTFTVGAGQIGAHMLFDWNTTTNIDVVDIWNLDQKFGPSKMYTGSGACNDASTVWDLMSTDWDIDGINGGKMVDGPFKGFSANFNIRLPGSPVLTCGAYVPTVNVADPSKAGGCSISPTPVKAVERADWWLLAGFLAWLGGIRIRFKSRQTKF
jgi:hypothetical protein